jgi:hypothetical protein
MDGFTDGETRRAIEMGGPGAAFSIALAEFARYWDCHPGNRPDLGHEPMINVRAHGLSAVEGVADWLGVTASPVCGTVIAKRHFGPDGAGLILEAHFTVDHDAAHVLRLQAGMRDAA